MQSWDDDAIVLNVRPHGDGGAVLTTLTPSHGKSAGFVYGLSKLKEKGGLEIGSIGHVYWQARLKEQMGTFRFEIEKNAAAPLLHDRARLAALQSACSLCLETLPERHASPALFAGLIGLLEALPTDHWGVSYIAWEFALLREIGFALDLSKCAVTGSEDVIYVSPRTGRGVSAEGAGEFADRLLPLPEFLKASPNMNMAGEEIDILTGLQLTGHFLERWVFVHHHAGIPAARLRLADLYATKVHGQTDSTASAAGDP
jgi:DNA repair protein RecO (recombination protein O)